MVKHLPTMQETWVWSLGQEDPLEKEIATQSNTLAWKIPWTEEPGRLQSMGVAKSRTRLSFNANVSRAKLEMVITHLVVLSTFETPDLHTFYHQSLVEIMKAEMFIRHTCRHPSVETLMACFLMWACKCAVKKVKRQKASFQGYSGLKEVWLPVLQTILLHDRLFCSWCSSLFSSEFLHV